ncbi:MAG: hypothetical protein CMH52_13400 [Myxococcales bacterium]|nr:hypothetical protein [Myxococcales bacterium]|tara:strand:- start:67 stop:669 length:603 start_codon:yes stop_codon:yes gene_type:complete
MLRIITAIFVAGLLAATPAMADDHKEPEARYSALVGVSPFGGSLQFGYNDSRQTSYQFAMGFFAGKAPIKPKINDIEYEIESETNWVGFFLNHRPSLKYEWFRLVAGFGIGEIENELDDGEGNTYQADYQENPVGYLGLGFGGQAKKGFIWAFDMGLLHTGGPNVYKTGGMGADESQEIADSFFFGRVLPNFQLSLGWGF